MAIGLGTLRLAPAAFWMMTPRELSAVLMGMFPEPGGLKRSGLADLMRRFPDP